VVRRSDGTSNGGLLFVIGKTLPREIRAATLRDLKNDRRLDIAASRSDMKRGGFRKGGTDRAASSAALAVEDDVTFCSIKFKCCLEIR
jgi:hypothetical protein